jgi:hypothetical protein
MTYWYFGVYTSALGLHAEIAVTRFYAFINSILYESGLGGEGYKLWVVLYVQYVMKGVQEVY